MKWCYTLFLLIAVPLQLCLAKPETTTTSTPLGLPPLPVPKNNPQTPLKIKLGNRLFHDTRFSTTGKISCATCHDNQKAFTDSPLKVSEGINKLNGTRNAPTVLNSAYMTSMFWDGREPDLEAQSAQPFLNPVEMGLKNHDPILKIVSTDPDYIKLFKQVFNKEPAQITMLQVKQAIAAFERTLISADSPFDRYHFGGDKKAMNESAIRGFDIFMNKGRCVSCHTVEQTHALFTDNRFHNLNVGFPLIAKDVRTLSDAFVKAKSTGTSVDVAVLSNKNISELGRFAVTNHWNEMGSFKTPTLRNVEQTAPYMHDGSLKTLEDVVSFYNNGGRVKETDPINDFQSSGMRSLDLSKQEEKDLVAFLKALTSPNLKALISPEVPKAGTTPTTTEPAKDTETTKAATPAKPAETAKAPEPAKAVDSTKTPEPAKAVDSTKAPEPAKAVDSAKAPEPAKTTETTKAPEPTTAPEPAKAPKVVQPKE